MQKDALKAEQIAQSEKAERESQEQRWHMMMEAQQVAREQMMEAHRVANEQAETRRTEELNKELRCNVTWNSNAKFVMKTS